VLYQSAQDPGERGRVPRDEPLELVEVVPGLKAFNLGGKDGRNYGPFAERIAAQDNNRSCGYRHNQQYNHEKPTLDEKGEGTLNDRGNEQFH
jgi:hypothetical protein